MGAVPQAAARDGSAGSAGSWSERYVMAPDGTRLYARRRGPESAPLTSVLCDGIACDGFIWKYLVDDLLAHGAVLHWNYRGHGRSAAPTDPDRIEMSDLVSDLDAVRDAWVPGPALLFGHSLGCQVALEGYRSRPRDVAGLVLICGAPGHVTHTFKGTDALAQALPGLIERVKRNPQLSRALWGNLPPSVATRIALRTGEVASNIRAEDLLPYMEHIADLDLLMFLRMLRAAGEVTADDVLPTLQVPVLVVAGELDSFTPLHLAERMAAQIPNSELAVFRGATHVVPIERREELRERIAKFVRDRVCGGNAP
ncbi:MAG: alpha/beta hydrolase [Polyangiaceae bacterium]|nr:alpha/beta hydrolase [Polyangiaceae bacterium]